MPISMYESSVPVFQRVLTALSGVIDKAVAHAEARKIDPDTGEALEDFKATSITAPAHEAMNVGADSVFEAMMASLVLSAKKADAIARTPSWKGRTTAATPGKHWRRSTITRKTAGMYLTMLVTGRSWGQLMSPR